RQNESPPAPRPPPAQPAAAPARAPRPPPAAAPAHIVPVHPPSPIVAAKAPVAPPPSETPTHCPDGDSPGYIDSPGEGGGDVVVAAAPTPPDISAGDDAAVSDDGDVSLSLRERAPDTDAVLTDVRSSHDIKMYFKNSLFHRKRADQDDFFQSSMWGEVGELLIEVIEACTPSNESELEEKRKLFEQKKHTIVFNHIAEYPLIFNHIAEYPLTQSQNRKKSIEIQSLRCLIGRSFATQYLKSIAPLSGSKIEPISEQISRVVNDAVQIVGPIFPLSIAQRIYYIVGFFGYAGEKEAARRTKKNDVGECIGSIMTHF
ncbi:hypothetical protein ACHAWF_007722, partial [Thalassiosira exigua]